MIRLVAERRVRADSIVPMINVAFLLLIFFLMTAVIAPGDPMEVTLPEAASDDLLGDGTVLVVSADGTLARGDLSGNAVFRGLKGVDIRVKADAALSGAELAKIFTRLRDAGVARAELVTVPR